MKDDMSFRIIRIFRFVTCDPFIADFPLVRNEFLLLWQSRNI